jgi:hypothetical protein
MRKITTLFFFIIYYTSNAQDTIDIVEKTIKISGTSRETEYYGFAEGDKVIFNLTVENNKELKDITISEYPGIVKFADHTTEKIENKILNISRKGIFEFEFYNSNISGRTIHVKIQRIPKSESTKFFNTNVKWITRVDTTFSARENKYLVGSDTSFVDVIDSKVRVHSQTNLDGPNWTIVDFIIPSNTIKWTYWIGVGNESQQAFQQDQINFSKLSTKIIGVVNPLAGLAFGLLSMTHSKLGDNVIYNFIPSWTDVQKFQARQPFMQFKTGNVITDFGLMNYGAVNNTKYYVALVNDNTTQGIDVNVKILAVVVNNKYNSVTEKVPTYKNELVPLNEE